MTTATTAKLRPATDADAPALADVFLAAWRSGYRGVVPDDVIDGLDAGELARTLGRRLGSTGQHTVAAVDPRDRPIGFISYGDDDEYPGSGCLISLYVHPAAGRAGIGRRLMRYALGQISDVDVRLWVFEGNGAARRLYEQEGFRPDGGRLTHPRWRTPQVRYRRPARNHARPLPPPPDIALPRIRAVRLTAVRRPLPAVLPIAAPGVQTPNALVVRLETADGAGLGSTVALPHISGETEESIRATVEGPLTACLLGSHTFAGALEAIHGAVDGNPCARAGADLAIHDLATRYGGTDLLSLLGNPYTPVRSCLIVGVDTPQAMAERAEHTVADGVDTVKLMLTDPAMDLARIRAVHAVRVRQQDRLGHAVRLRLDAMQSWTPAQAVALLDEVHTLSIDIELVEQPVAAADLGGLALVRSRSPFLVVADESARTAADIRRVTAAGAADLVTIKLLKCGGLAPARDAIAACADAGVGVLIGCMPEPAEGIAAARALAATGTAGPLAHDVDARWAA